VEPRQSRRRGAWHGARLAGALARERTDAVVAGALARIGPAAGDAVPVLVEALRSPNADRRFRAARTLGRIGPAASAAAAPLAEALADPSAEVRQHAAARSAASARPRAPRRLRRCSGPPAIRTRRCAARRARPSSACAERRAGVAAGRARVLPFARMMRAAVLRAFALVVVVAVALRVLALGYLPYDDALRHAAKAVSGRPWSEILLLRPGFELDSNPGGTRSSARCTGCSASGRWTS